MWHLSLPRLFFALLGVASVLALAPAAAPAAAQAAAGAEPVVVIDGDTIELNGETIGLYGIDAPELGQLCSAGSRRYRCGFDAAVNLRKIVERGPVACRPTPVDAADNGQICSIDLVDLAEAMLRQGYAVAKPSALALYRRAENEAKRSRLGIWRGDFVPPSAWRAGNRLSFENGDPMQICDIKGIVSDKGERVYFLPTDSDYESITLDASRGERTFCSDDEAELLGWRRWPKAAVTRRRGAAGPQ